MNSRAPLRVLRVCSVFQSDSVAGRARRFDAVGGMQNHTAQLTRSLDALGVTQTVLTAWRPGVPRRTSWGGAATVRRLGYPVRRFRQLYWLPGIAHAVREGARHDVVHAHLGEDIAVVPLAILAARRSRRPLVLTVHASLRHTVDAPDVRTRLVRLLGAPLEGVGERRADAIVTLTPRLRRLLLAEGVTAPVHVIPSGIDAALLDAERADPLPGIPSPRILYVGRLSPQKGVQTLVDAVAALERFDGHLVLVGDGPARAAVERRVAAAGLSERVVFVGSVPHRDVPAYLQHADVFVLPSVYEELGSVLLEAMRTGPAIVATRVGGIPDAIRDGATGLLVEPEDPAALAATLTRLLADAALRQRLVAAARAASDDYRWDVLARRMLSVYEEVMA